MGSGWSSTSYCQVIRPGFDPMPRPHACTLRAPEGEIFYSMCQIFGSDLAKIFDAVPPPFTIPELVAPYLSFRSTISNAWGCRAFTPAMWHDGRHRRRIGRSEWNDSECSTRARPPIRGGGRQAR